MSKVIVIGCECGSKVALDICRQYPSDEILFYEKAENVPIPERGFKHVEVHKLEMPKIVEPPFIPKAKHCTKGHERPYKFHR